MPQRRALLGNRLAADQQSASIGWQYDKISSRAASSFFPISIFIFFLVFFYISISIFVLFHDAWLRTAY